MSVAAPAIPVQTFAIPSARPHSRGGNAPTNAANVDRDWELCSVSSLGSLTQRGSAEESASFISAASDYASTRATTPSSVYVFEEINEISPLDYS